MTKVTQIKIGRHQTGIIGLEDALKQIAQEGAGLSGEKIGACLVKKLSEKNYIPAGVTDLYEAAFLREYKKFTGEEVPPEPVEGIEIKVLGAGCPNCERLTSELMNLTEKMNIEADIEHVRDIQRIAEYGVMGSPALVINGKIRTVGTLPSRARLKEFILDAEDALTGNK